MARTVDQIDADLQRAHDWPHDERGDMWAAWVDGLLNERVRAASTSRARREMAVVHPPETR